MEEEKKELSITTWTDTKLRETMWTDTKKLAVWKQDISDAIEWSKSLRRDQITPSLDKREKDLAKKRSHEN